MAVATAVTVLTVLPPAYAQNLPDKIRGYKVHSARAIVVTSKDDSRVDAADVSVKVGEPRLAEMTLSGAVFDVDVEFRANNSGKVDLITFHDFEANKLAFMIDEMPQSFSFKKNRSVTLRLVARVSISLTSIPRAAYMQIVESPEDLTVTGTAFVFGRFKKFGMTFKRVVPVKVDIKIKNPLYRP
jgi:hypothetical protein